MLTAAAIGPGHSLAHAHALAAALTVTTETLLWTGDPEPLGEGAGWR